MGALRKLADRFDPETRAASSWDLIPGANMIAGVPANPHAAENLATVLSCVSAISMGIASLPARVLRQVEGGREPDPTHPLTRLIKRGPNAHQTWNDWLEWGMASALLRGNWLSEVMRDNGGRLTGLDPIPWDWVSVQLLPSGRLAYDVSDHNGRMRRLLEDEVLHIKDRSDDGLVGKPRLQRAAAVVNNGLAISEFNTSMWANGANPSGALLMEKTLSESGQKRLKKQFADNYYGVKNAAKTLVLEDGLKWQQISVSPEDAELLASRRFSGEELARIFNVPPPIIGDLSHGTFTNSETAGRWFAQFTLTSWICKIEREFTRSVFSEAFKATHELDIDLSGLLRGDPETRWKSHKIAVDAGILDTDEIRALEGFNPKGQAA